MKGKTDTPLEEITHNIWIYSVIVTVIQSCSVHLVLSQTTPGVNRYNSSNHSRDWLVENFPDPRTDLGPCGRNGKPSSVCDPDNILSQEQGR